VSRKNKAREFLALFYLKLMKFFIKFGGVIPESTQDTNAVAFLTKPVIPLPETFYFNDVL